MPDTNGMLLSGHRGEELLIEMLFFFLAIISAKSSTNYHGIVNSVRRHTWSARKIRSFRTLFSALNN